MGRAEERGGARATYAPMCPSPRVSPCPLGRLLVREPDCGVGGCGFAVDRLVAVCDGEAVVCGAPAVDAGV